MEIKYVVSFIERDVQGDCQGDLFLYCVWVVEIGSQIVGVKEKCQLSLVIDSVFSMV